MIIDGKVETKFAHEVDKLPVVSIKEFVRGIGLLSLFCFKYVVAPLVEVSRDLFRGQSGDSACDFSGVALPSLSLVVIEFLPIVRHRIELINGLAILVKHVHPQVAIMDVKGEYRFFEYLRQKNGGIVTAEELARVKHRDTTDSCGNHEATFVFGRQFCFVHRAVFESSISAEHTDDRIFISINSSIKLRVNAGVVVWRCFNGVSWNLFLVIYVVPCASVAEFILNFIDTSFRISHHGATAGRQSTSFPVVPRSCNTS